MAGLAAGAAMTAGVGWVVVGVLDHYFTDSDAPKYHVVVQTDPAEYEAGQPNTLATDYVLPRGVQRAGAPPGDVCREWHPWAVRQGGVDSGETKVRVVLQAEASASVLLQGLDVRIESRRPVLAGDRVLCRTGGAYGVLRGLDVDLDARPPTVTYSPDGERRTTKPLLFKLTGAETEIFEIRAKSRSCLCAWSARLHLIADGKRRTVEVTDDGRPFRTTSGGANPVFEWDSRRWVRRPELDGAT